MATGSKGIMILRTLLVFLILVITLTIVTFFWIRAAEREKISEALDYLRVKDRTLEMMEKSFQKLYEADNDFWLYTLTYDPAYSKKYADDFTELMAILDSLKVGLEADPPTCSS